MRVERLYASRAHGGCVVYLLFPRDEAARDTRHAVFAELFDRRGLPHGLAPSGPFVVAGRS